MLYVEKIRKFLVIYLLFIFITQYARIPVAGPDSKPLKVFCCPTNLVNKFLKEINMPQEIKPDRSDQFERVAQNLQAR